MRTTVLSLVAVLFCLQISAQSLCNTASEGGTVTLTAPVGSVFISVSFASYGTPNGSCGAFTIGGCHASNSLTIVQTALVGNNSASIPATNGLFGDPCGGTVKRLYVQAVYAVVTPLKLISFAGTLKTNGNLLQWETSDEVNVRQFEIERSTDGIQFSVAGTLTANNRAGNNRYAYTDNNLASGTHFYRLKMIDSDGKFVYSNIIRLTSQPKTDLLIFPNPVTDHVTLSGLKGKGLIELTSINGKVLLKMNTSAQTQMINVADFPGGIYILRYSSDTETSSHKIVKQ